MKISQTFSKINYDLTDEFLSFTLKSRTIGEFILYRILSFLVFLSKTLG